MKGNGKKKAEAFWLLRSGQKPLPRQLNVSKYGHTTIIVPAMIGSASRPVIQRSLSGLSHLVQFLYDVYTRIVRCCRNIITNITQHHPTPLNTSQTIIPTSLNTSQTIVPV
ncbi:hypothetical protein ACMFMG_008171 [Clarireedia jacksonii]